MSTMTRKFLQGWGGALKTYCAVQPYEGRIDGQGIARGLGRSYGDASFCQTGTVWLMETRNQLLHSEGSLFVAQAGMSLYALIRQVLPQGYFPPVVPGTQFVTLGGAFASNIHGKNHHVAGSFAEHVEWIELRTPDGELRRLDSKDPLFWATAGGMGLTGVIETIALRLEAIPSSEVLVRILRLPDWDSLLSTMESEEMRYPFAVAWIDHAHPRNRGILHLGRFAEERRIYRFHPAERLSIPFTLPFSLVGRLTVPLIAEWYWWKHSPGERVVSYAEFFFPLDGIGHWNRLWGERGFVQFQFVVPSRVGLERLWERLRSAPARSFLTVLKRLRAQAGPLGFSGPGWTLAIDLPATDAVKAFLIRLTDLVIEEGGRIYLTKDSLLLPEQARAMYPEWENFRRLKARIDPEGRLRSNLSQRLRLTE